MRQALTKLACLCLVGLVQSSAVSQALKNNAWHAATEAELKEIIPARAAVEKERIETELRTATGITDGRGNFVAAVLLITAGYSADGKYSHFLMNRVPIRVGDLSLKAGEYALGWQRNTDSLSVRFYDAPSGVLVGTVEAVRNSRIGRIESLHIYPPNEKALVQIGRFAFGYRLGE